MLLHVMPSLSLHLIIEEKLIILNVQHRLPSHFSLSGIYHYELLKGNMELCVKAYAILPQDVTASHDACVWTCKNHSHKLDVGCMPYWYKLIQYIHVIQFTWQTFLT